MEEKTGNRGPKFLASCLRSLPSFILWENANHANVLGYYYIINTQI